MLAQKIMFYYGFIFVDDLLKSHLFAQPRSQGFPLAIWHGREKTLASAGHVSILNIPPGCNLCK